MTDRVESEARLRRLLSEALAEVEPSDRLEELRASVRPSSKVVPMTAGAGRRTWYSATGVIATAAVIGLVALVTNVVGDRSRGLGPATDSGTSSPAVTATATDTSAPVPRAGTAVPRPVTVYYLGNGPRGAVLFRERSTPPAGMTALTYGVRGLMTDPSDPDYRTPWRSGWLVRATRDAGLISVQVGPAPAVRPPSLTPREATEAVQQVVYTVQSALGLRDKVRFVRRGRPVTSLLGVPTSRPVAAAPASKALARLAISTPDDGAHLARGRLVVTGVDDVFGPDVEVELVRSGTTYLHEAGTAIDAYEPDRMFPWKVTLDTSSVPPGRYTVVAGKGHGMADRDTRTVVLR